MPVSIAKGFTAATVPSVIVATHFLVGDLWSYGMAWFFAMTGSAATFAGCLAAVLVLRRRVAQLPYVAVLTVSAIVAGLLLVLFQAMSPSWPVASVGLMMSWVLMAAGFMMALICGASYRYV